MLIGLLPICRSVDFCMLPVCWLFGKVPLNFYSNLADAGDGSGFAEGDPDFVSGEAVQQSLRDFFSQGFKENMRGAAGYFSHAVGDDFVVDGIADPPGFGGQSGVGFQFNVQAQWTADTLFPGIKPDHRLDAQVTQIDTIH